MALPQVRPINEVSVFAQTTSIATTPVAGVAVAPVTGYIDRVFAVSDGTTTGTITVAVKINGGSDIASGALQIAAGSGNANNAGVQIPLVGSGAAHVAEGDVITFTPSGGTGTSIPGAFAAVIRT